ncbi:MAG: MarR family transcriptional regulator [Acidobacteriota bacterium]
MSQAHDLIASCRALYAEIDRLDQAAATKVGVSRNDLRALNVLENGAVSAGALARDLGITTGAATALIDRLERKGLARRMRDPNDRRGVLIEPTPAMFTQLAPLYRGVATRLLAVAERYGEEELRAAIRHLDTVTQAYRDAIEADAVP